MLHVPVPNTMVQKPVIQPLALCGPKKTPGEGNPMPAHGDGEQWRESESVPIPKVTRQSQERIPQKGPPIFLIFIY